MKLLEIQKLNKRIGDRQILHDVSLTLESGKIYGLLGQNGAGKSTLIKIINDIMQPSSGTVLYRGHAIGVKSKAEISYLPERSYLDPDMRVREAVQLFADFYQNFDAKKAQNLLADLDLDIDAKIAAMSKGMREKLQLALVMSRKAKLYILDEPLGGVDPATRDYIIDVILNNFDEGASLVISTHLVSDIERILDEVIFIKKGEIILQESAEHIRTKDKMSIDAKFRKMFKPGKKEK